MYNKTESLNEELKIITDLSSYKPWSGAVDTWRKIEDADKVEELDAILEDSYPEGMTETELNDLLWFDGDEVLSWLGLGEEEVDEELEATQSPEDAKYYRDELDKIADDALDLAREANVEGVYSVEDAAKAAEKAIEDREEVINEGKELTEDLNLITLTKEDQAQNIRSLIKVCWDSVDQYSMYAQQLNEFGSQQALETVNTLINDLYIAIGEFENVLGTVDPKSAAIDAPTQVEVVAQVAPQVVQQMAQAPVVPVLEKFTLDEGDTLNEDVEEKPEVQKELEEPVKKELKEVEKYRKEKVEDSLNPEPEELDESVDDTLNPHFYESLLKLED